MLYCKKCGAEVGASDIFCTSCSSRLNRSNVVTKSGLSGMAAEKSEFSADAVAEPDLTGFNVMGMRLTEKLFFLMGADYYRAVKANGEECVPLMIRHMIFPDRTDRDCVMLNNLSCVSVADVLCKGFAEEISKETAAFACECAAAGVPSLNYRTEVQYSALFNVYHIFTLMNYAIPLPLFVRQEELSIRGALEIGAVISDSLMRLEKNHVHYGAFSDCMLFVSRTNTKDNDGHSVTRHIIYPDCRLPKCYERFLPMCSYMSYFRQYLSPKRKNYEVYSLGMIVYRLLSGGRHPYVRHRGAASASELMQAEKLRMEMSEPAPLDCLQNTIGMVIGDVLSRSAHDITLNEFGRIIANSFNYVQAGDLNKKISFDRTVSI